MGDNPKSLAKAQAMPLWKLDAGEFHNIPSVSIPEVGAFDTHNVVFFDGRLQARPGFSLATVSPHTDIPGFDGNSSIPHLGYMVTQDQQYHLIRVQSSNTTNRIDVFQFNGAGNWANITGAMSLTKIPEVAMSSAQFKGEFLLCTGNSNLLRWNGAGSLVDVTAAQANASLKAPADPYFVCATGSRVFLANAIDQSSGLRVPYRVWWSQTLDSGIWSDGAGLPAQGSASYQDLIQGRDSSPITGMYFQGATQVVVFKRHSIYRGVFKGGPVWYDFLSITQSRGCVASKSIQCYNDTLVWLGDDYNIYAMQLNGQITAIGDAVRPRIQQVFDPAYDNGCSVSSSLDVVLGIYWLIIPKVEYGALRHYVFACNLRTGAWSEGMLADESVFVKCGFWLQPDPPFYVQAPIAIWGFSNGRIYSFDYTKRYMLDVNTPFEAHWWSRTHDFIQLGKGAGETAEFHKLSLHGLDGVAVPRIRMGRNIAEVTGNRRIYTFPAMDLGSEDCPAYVAGLRANADRFGQVGVHWPPGTRKPAIIEGVTSWGLARQEAR